MYSGNCANGGLIRRAEPLREKGRKRFLGLQPRTVWVLGTKALNGCGLCSCWWVWGGSKWAGAARQEVGDSKDKLEPSSVSLTQPHRPLQKLVSFPTELYTCLAQDVQKLRRSLPSRSGRSWGPSRQSCASPGANLKPGKGGSSGKRTPGLPRWM